jgi:hypothetical protein
MVRQHRGRTKLGGELNKIGSKTDSIKTSVSAKRKGYIKECVGNRYLYYVVIVKFIKNASGQHTFVDDFIPTKPIPLSNPPSELVGSSGTPEELVGQCVEVSFVGQSLDGATAKLIKDFRNSTIAEEVDEVLQVSQLNQTGSAFAPPGGGLV